MTVVRPARPGTARLANALTVLRVVLVPVIAVLVLAGGTAAQWWACAVFVFAAFTDTLDGWAARRVRAGVTRWGQLADPLADKVLIIGTLVVLAVQRRLPWLVVAVIVVREVAVTLQRSWLARRGVVMPASQYGKLKTVSQVVAITLYLVPAVPTWLAHVALAVAVVLTILSGVEYAFRGKRLIRRGAA